MCCPSTSRALASNTTSRTRTPTASSSAWCPRARPPAACAAACAAPFCIRWPTAWAAHKMALGHHRDDIVANADAEPVLRRAHEGMPPKLVSDDGKHVVTPAVLCAEKDTPAGPSTSSSPSFRATCAAAKTACSAWWWGEMMREWDKNTQAASKACSAPWAMWSPHLMDPKLHDFQERPRHRHCRPQRRHGI